MRSSRRFDAKSLRGCIVAGPGARRVLRLLLPSECRFDCDGCPFALPEGARDAELDALARAAVSAYRLGLCDGVFVLAGLPRDASAATRRLLQLVELLRFTHGFRGYLHVKALPGAAPALTERLVRLVDRVSYALEAPCAAALRDIGGLAPEAAQALETRALAELQRARRASARSSPPLLPAAARPVRTGAVEAVERLQPSLFDARNTVDAKVYKTSRESACAGAA